MKTFTEIRKPVNTEKYDAYYAMVDAKKMAKKKGGKPDDYIDDLMKKRGYKKSSYSGHGVWKWVKEGISEDIMDDLAKSLNMTPKQCYNAIKLAIKAGATVNDLKKKFGIATDAAKKWIDQFSVKEETINEGQLEINFKNFARSEKKKLIKLLNSLEVKRKFNLKSVTSPMLDRSVTVRAYYLDLDDLRDYLKDKGYKWKDGKMWAGKPMDITMEAINEGKWFKVPKSGLSDADSAKISAALKAGKTVTGKSDRGKKYGEYKILKLYINTIGINRVKKAYVDWGEGKKPMDRSFITSYSIDGKVMKESFIKEDMIQDFEIRFGKESDWKKADKLVKAYLRIHAPKHAKALLKKDYVHGPDPLMVAFGDTKQKLNPPVNLNKLYNTIRKLPSSRMKYWQAIPKKQEKDAIGEGTMRSGIFDSDVKKRKDAARKLVFFLKQKRNLKIGPMDDKQGGSNKAIDGYIKELMKYVFDDIMIDDLYPTGKNANVKANDVVVKRLKKMGVKVK